MSIEIFRKGFRFDIKPDQVVTFKKSQNLNGIQDRYAYSNTINLEDTANNRKLLELMPLPTNKVTSLMNGYEVDVVLNGSINLRNQTLKIQKENKDNIETYLLYTDNALVIKLKASYVNEVAATYTYKKNISDFVSYSAFVETQPKSGLFVIEEMPRLINLQELLEKIFVANAYNVYGDFFEADSVFSDYFIAPNKGVYQIYSGSGEGFAPTFDPVLDCFTFLNNVLAYFNCYAEVDDTYRTVVVNRWTNLQNFKTSYVDYSKHFVDYKDYAFQSKLAKRNELKYTDSGTAYDSFFANNLSSEDKATYLSSAFGTGSLNLFDDSKIEEGGTIPVRANGAVGEIAAVKIFKKSSEFITANVYIAGVATPVTNIQAVPVSMQTVYTEFHKDYTDFILTPLVSNLVFKYDGIMAADFSMTKVFFVEQLASYWIPLEINFTTKKDLISVRAMLIKKRKVESPVLNNFNSILLDFKEKAVFPLSTLLTMYPIPPNKYDWDIIIFKSYDQTKNRLYVNDVLISSASLPQAFALADIETIKFEANEPGDTVADTDSDSFYIQAIDTNGGVSNEAYINVVHTGVASLESNFEQPETYTYTRNNFDSGREAFTVLEYVTGLKPNLNDTVTSVAYYRFSPSIFSPDSAYDPFNLVISNDAYTNVKVNIPSFSLRLKTENNGIGKARATIKIILFDGVNKITLTEYSSANNSDHTYTTTEFNRVIADLPIGRKVRVYFDASFDNRRGLNSGSMDVLITVDGFKTNISTIKIL